VNALIPLLVLALSAPGPAHREPASVLIPEAGPKEECLVAERLASELAAGGRARVVRAPLSGDEPLETARARLGARYAVRGRRSGGPKVETLHLELAREGAPAADRTVEILPAAGGGGHELELLEAMLEGEAGALSSTTARLTRDAHDALLSACAGDGPAAYALAGAALGPAVRRLVRPPPPANAKRPEPDPLLVRWARASWAARDRRFTDAADGLKRVQQAIKDGASAPLWRRTAREGGAPSMAFVSGDVAMVFDSGAFEARELAGGTLRWRLELGRADPRLFETEGLFVATTDKELVAIDRQTGGVRWRVALASPEAELAGLGDRIFAAGTEDVLALSKKDGRVEWRFDPVGKVVAGPVEAGGRIAVPIDDDVLLFDPSSGVPNERIPLEDEIAGPLYAAPDGAIWTIVGGDTVAVIRPHGPDPAAPRPWPPPTGKAASGPVAPPPGTVKLKIKDVLGAAWPPQPTLHGMSIAGRNDRSGGWLVLADTSAQPRVTIMVRPALPPTVAFSDPRPGGASGVVYVEPGRTVAARDGAGRVLWRTKLDDPPVALAALGNAIGVAAGRNVLLLDARSGKRKLSIDAGEPLASLSWTAAGGVALAKSGALLGLPSGDDPRRTRWLRELDLELAAAWLSLGRSKDALSAVAELLPRAPALATAESDLDALLVVARAREAAQVPAKDGASDWIAVASRVPAGDPLAVEARRHLAGVPAIAAVLSVGAPLSGALTATAGVYAVWTASESVGIGQDERVRWRAPAAEVAAVGDGIVAADKQLLGAADGTAVRDLGSGSFLLPGAGVYRLTKGGGRTELQRETAEGTARWAPLVVPESARALAASDSRLFLTAAAPHLIGIDALAGHQLFEHRLESAVRRAWLSGGTLLVQLENGVWSMVDASSGERAPFEPPAATPGSPPPELEVVPAASPEAFFVFGGKRLWSFSRSAPKPALVAQLSDEIRAFEPLSSLVALGDGSVAQLDLASGKLLGRVKLGPVVRILPGRPPAALLPAGLVVLDPAALR
jgi:outer membrane protein assembly factor BamB